MWFKKKTQTAKILLVDDEPDVVSVVSRSLQLNGYEVITAANGKEGLEKAIHEQVDLVLLDAGMPVMNGWDMLERLRSHPVSKDIPVIMVTAFSERQDVAKASTYGISDYVTKPFDFIELTERVGQALKSKRKRKAAISEQ